MQLQGMHYDTCVAVAAASHGMLSYGNSGPWDAAHPLAWSEACPTACRALACLQRCGSEQITCTPAVVKFALQSAPFLLSIWGGLFPKHTKASGHRSQGLPVGTEEMGKVDGGGLVKKK